ncbi:uncharacterized protein [Chironomus tepperi]|uniref:uncharacterized protein n=1 Tax=Chironomus tepperi TaxID=113505 RepID=UPI00391FB856
MKSLITSIIIALQLLTASSIDKFPDPYDCNSFITYHGKDKEVWSCSAGLHFSPTKFECLSPGEAKCHRDYWCPDVDDVKSPVFVADPVDCKVYYHCSHGIPVRKVCDADLWWDIVNKACTSKEYVTCDKRAIINPNNLKFYDGSTVKMSETAAVKKLESLKSTQTQPEPIKVSQLDTSAPQPKVEVCSQKKDLFDGPNYLKSVCLVHAASTYDAAREKCASYNMNLFIIDDYTVETQLYDAVTVLLASYPRGSVWINGKRDGHAKRFKIFNADGSIKGPLSRDVTLYSRFIAGNCLKFSGAYGPYQAQPEPCTSALWFICEHHKRTEIQPLLDTTSCLHKRDLRVGGNYIKSMCMINVGYTYDEGRRTCAKNGMNLFIFDDKIVEEAFHEVAEDVMKSIAGGYLWINGMRDLVTNQWNVFNANRTIQGDLYKDIEWVNKDAIRGKINGECLRYSGQYGPYQALGVACTEKSWIVCEYFD